MERRASAALKERQPELNRHKACLKAYSIPLFVIGLLLAFGRGTLSWSGEDSPVQALAAPQPSIMAAGATYYVAPSGDDEHPGTQAKPWQTIQKAASFLGAGDTVYIRAGTYAEQVIPQNSGSAGNTITYAAYPGETVTIDGAGMELPAYETGLFVLEDINYIKVSGLRIINAGPYENNAGIYVDNAHNIIVEDNYISNTVSSGIGVWDGSNVIIDGNEVRLACNDGEQEMITVSGTDTFEVKNNEVYDGGPGTNGGEGITIKGGATNGKIYQNHVHDITHGERTCLYVDGWGETKATSNIEIYQNIFHNCGAGISLASEDGGLVRNVKIYNNIVYDNQSNGLEIGSWGEPGVSVRPVEGITFINNTVYNNGSSGWGGGFYNDNPDVTDIVVRNNIFGQNPTSQIVNESTASLTVDHNLIDGSQEYAYAINGTDYVEGDPRFLNAPGADFRLQTDSPALDRGSSVDAPDGDFEGNPRPQDGDGDGTSTYDIGAFEVAGLTATPRSRAIDLGGVATYTIHVGAIFTSTVTLVIDSPPPSLTWQLAPTQVYPPGQVTLVVTDSHPGPVLLPGLWYSIPITATDGITRTTSVRLLVGGTRLYLPVILKSY